MQLEDWVVTALAVVGIVVGALVIQVLIRQTASPAIRRLIERRARERDDVGKGEIEQRVVTLQQLTIRVSGIFLASVALLMILATVGIEIAPALAGLGVVGIAVGFGAQKIFRDWLAGIFIVVENQYSVGDVVSIAGVSGMVEDISLRRTLLRDLAGTVHTVPNGDITVASNMTADWSRVNLDVEVAYDTDIGRASSLIDRIGQDLVDDPEWGPRLMEAPSVLRVDNLGDSGVTLKVLGRVQPAEQWGVAGELRKRILATFNAEGIEIPFPHRVVMTRTDGD
jgi:moderate conductance mechanosensitive channel